MTLAKQRLLVFLMPLLLAAPFLNRAYFVDDHFFIEIAQWIKDHPLDPYSFRVDNTAPASTISKEDLELRIVNPLLHHYYLAAFMKLGFNQEWFLRLACVLLSCFSGLFILALARRWTKHPLIATLLVQAAPVHWLTSYSLLIDSTLAFFFLGAVVSFVAALERDSLPLALSSGFCIGCALLTKYTAILILPLTAVWCLLNRDQIKRKSIFIGAWMLGVAMFFASMLATRYLYGHSHAVSSSGATLHAANMGKILVLLVFASGVTLSPLIVWVSLKRNHLIAAALTMIASIMVLLNPKWGGFLWQESFLLTLWALTSLILLVQFAALFRSWSRPADSFLFIWVISFFVMMTFVMQWTAARYFMIAAPAVVFLIVRTMELARPRWATQVLSAGLAISLFGGLGLAYADYQQAETSRRVVSWLKDNAMFEGANNYYFSDAYTMTYLAQAGWKPCGDPTTLNVGDRIITTDVSLPVRWFLRRRPPMKLITHIDFPTSFPIKVMDSANLTSFYASAWGPLPFSFSKRPWERFYLFEIIPAS